MRRVSPFSVLLLLSLPTAALAQPQPIDSDTLRQQLDAVRDKINLVAVGATVLVGGKIVAEAVVGERRQGSDVPVTIDDKWHHGSITKSMTATVIAKLVERGELAWDSRLPELLPEMAADFDASWEQVTLLHILTHSAGLPVNFPLRVQFIRPDSRDERREIRRRELAAILASPATSAPGDKYEYSNVGYTLAGLIAEEATGLPWETLMERELFEPLKLTTAGFGPPVGKEELDQPWGHVRALFMRHPRNPADRADNTPVMGPAGIVHMSMKDLATYGWEHLRGETSSDALLQPKTFRRLHEPVIADYGCGWHIWQGDWADGRVISHTGSNTMWYSLLALVPSRNAVIVVVTNDGNADAAGTAFIALAESIVAALPVAVPNGP